MSSKPSWEANPRNNDKRVNAYTSPYVNEVIFKDEWKQKPTSNVACWMCHSHHCKCGHIEYLRSKRNDDNDHSGILIILCIVIMAIVYIKIGGKI